jgi:hypothetical protein
MKLAVASVLATTTLACIDVSSLQSRPPKMDGDAGAEDAAVACVTCSPMGCVSPPDDNPNLVSGLESGCFDHENRNGRNTTWFTFANGASTVSPLPMFQFVPTCLGANGSCYAACMSGQLAGDSYPFAGMGVALSLALGSYDLSQYRGVRFYLLGTIDPGSRLRFSVPTVEVASVGGGGTCTDAEKCNDAYQVDVPGFEPGIPNTNWSKVQVTFDMLGQIGFGIAEPWDPAHVISLTWVVYSPLDTVLTDQLYTVCVDQVELF